MDDNRHRFYYGWVIVAVSFFTLFFSIGTRHSFGVYYIAILREYGWGRAETAGAFSLAMLTHALFAPVTGILVDRLGPRRLFPGGALFLFIGLLAASRISNIWHLYLFFGVLVAIGINSMSYAPHMSIIPRWFIRRKGLASGLMASGMGLGTLILVPFNELMIEAIGWRSAFLLLSGIILILLVPINALCHRNSPRDIGQFPDGMAPGHREPTPCAQKRVQGDKALSADRKQWTLKQAARTKAFWYIFLSCLFDSVIINMLLVHQAVHTVDLGYSVLLAATLVGLVGVLGSAGGILCGFLSDLIGRAASYTLAGLLSFIGILFFILIRDASSTWMLYAFVILHGLGNGGKSPMAANIAGDLFPGRSLGRIMAIQSMGFGVGGSLGAYMGGYFYDKTGSYIVPFLILLAGICIGIFAIWMAVLQKEGISQSS
ncbi:MFS transporter [Thermodesulfobacteriota bacterium]